MQTEPERAKRKIRRRNWPAHLWREWWSERERPIAPAKAKPTPETWSDNNLTATWLGHSTVLINFYGIWIITDPVLSSRIGIRLPFLTIGPKRLTAPALTFPELPPIDAILLSHAHFDHLDRRTLKLFPKSTQVVTARGTRDLLRGTKLHQVTELDWGERIRLTTHRMEIELIAFRAQHWGARLRYDQDRGYNSYIILRNHRRIIYSSDTAMTQAFTKLHNGKPYDLAIMSIGAYTPWISFSRYTRAGYRNGRRRWCALHHARPPSNISAQRRAIPGADRAIYPRAGARSRTHRAA